MHGVWSCVDVFKLFPTNAFLFIFIFILGAMFFFIAVTGIMAPWITQWSITTMESKVFLNAIYYYLFLCMCVCVFLAMLSVSSHMWTKTRKMLRKLGPTWVLFFAGASAHPNGSSCLGRSRKRGHLIRMRTHVCGGISDMDYIWRASVWTPPNPPSRDLRMWFGFWKFEACCCSDLEKAEDGGRMGF